MKKFLVFPLCLSACLYLISCGQNQKTTASSSSPEVDSILVEIPKTEEVTTPTKEELTPSDYYSMSFINPGDKIHYGEVHLLEAGRNDWGKKIIAIIDNDTIDVPYPHKEPSDLTYSNKGDLNGNGYNDIIIGSGSFGTCCSPNYTIASYDGEKFRLTETIEWVEDYDVKTFDTHSRIAVKREMISPDVNTQFKDTTVYEYKNYQLKQIFKISAKNITADRELTTTDIYNKEYPKTDMYGKEAIGMPYVVNEKDSLRVLALAGFGRGLLEVYLFDDHKEQHYRLASEVARVGVLPIKQEGYPLLVINMDEIYTKNGPYKGDVNKIYQQLKAMGKM